VSRWVIDPLVGKSAGNRMPALSGTRATTGIPSASRALLLQRAPTESAATQSTVLSSRRACRHSTTTHPGSSSELRQQGPLASPANGSILLKLELARSSRHASRFGVRQLAAALIPRACSWPPFPTHRTPLGRPASWPDRKRSRSRGTLEFLHLWRLWVWRWNLTLVPVIQVRALCFSGPEGR
jgi:hypothetical protein